MWDWDDFKFVVIVLVLCVLAPFTIISSFVFTAKLYSTIFNIPCEVCDGVEK